MLREVYLLIKNHLATEIDSVKNIDWDLQQYNQVSEDYVLTTPSIYIGFDPITWLSQLHNIQRAVLTFNVTLVNDTAYGTDQDMTDKQFINHLAIEGQIHAALANQRFLLSVLPEFAALANTSDDRTMIESVVRISSTPHAEISNLIVTTQTFQCTIFDYSAVKSFQSVLAQLNLTVQIQE